MSARPWLFGMHPGGIDMPLHRTIGRLTHRLLMTSLLAFAAGVCWPSGGQAPAADAIPPATDAPKPLPPEESRKHFRLADGFRIELVAAEPQLAEPTGMCFDARGRIFVCELHGYNLDGYYDIVELNKTGRLDTAVRRIPATKAAEERAARETCGTVKLPPAGQMPPWFG